MPGHEKHREESIRWFAIFSSLLAVCTVLLFRPVYAILIIPVLTVVAYPAVRAGAMFPDIDISSSKPYSALMFSIPVLCVLLATVIYIRKSDFTVRSIFELVFKVVLGYVIGRIIRVIVDRLLRRINHRGPTHRASTGGLIGLGLGGIVYHLLRGTVLHSLRFVLSPVVASSFLVGHLSHLFLDQKHAKDGYRIRF